MSEQNSGADIERLVLKADTFAVEVLPAFGGKIASMRKNAIELLQQPLAPYTPRTMTMGFEESDASGFDECLPTVSACTIDSLSGPLQIPDHGEFWRLPCSCEPLADNQLRLTATGSILPLRFERILHVQGSTLRIDYRLENIGVVAVPYAWSAHPLFAVDPGDRIVVPSAEQITVEGSAHHRLGSSGAVKPWPNATLKDGSTTDLTCTGNPGDDIGDKIYAAAPPEGWCALVRERLGFQITVRFDPVQCPFLGLWLCYGGWPQGSDRRQNCVALEPCTGPVDSLATAIAHGEALTLLPGQFAAWWMTIDVSVVS